MQSTFDSLCASKSRFTWRHVWGHVETYGDMYMSFQGRLTQFFGAVKVCVDNAVAGMVLSGLQGDPLEWVSSHRYHHQFCDTEMDPHTPYEGFWHSHMGWLLDEQPLHQRVRSHDMVFYFRVLHSFSFPASLIATWFASKHLFCTSESAETALWLKSCLMKFTE